MFPSPFKQRAFAPHKHINVDAIDPIPPGSTGPSGVAMPDANLTGWNLSWSQDFNTACVEGNFLSVYGSGLTYDPATAVHSGQCSAYPTTYLDTSKRGEYDPGVLSVEGGILRQHIYTDGGGIHHVSALAPRLSASGKWGDVPGGRFAMRCRSDVLSTYKVAWLLWPGTGTNTTGAANGVGGNGEIDFPECNLDGTSFVNAFMHKQNATSGSDQYSSPNSTAKLTDAGWHTYECEWLMGASCKFFVDGVQLGVTQTSRVPATPMHWILQTETVLSLSTPIDANVAGYVYIDWLVYWSPA